MIDDTDGALARRAAEGDREAFAALVERHYDRIYRIGTRVLGDADAAADLAQDVCVALPAKLSSYHGRSRFTTWLYRVVVNAARDALRRRAARRRSERGYAELDGLMRNQAAADECESTWLRQALGRLSEELRVTVFLVLEEGLRHRGSGRGARRLGSDGVVAHARGAQAAAGPGRRRGGIAVSDELARLQSALRATSPRAPDSARARAVSEAMTAFDRHYQGTGGEARHRGRVPRSGTSWIRRLAMPLSRPSLALRRQRRCHGTCRRRLSSAPRSHASGATNAAGGSTCDPRRGAEHLRSSSLDGGSAKLPKRPCGAAAPDRAVAPRAASLR